ncbi:MAG TPA: glycosyltransferase [Bryobacteraceae bacterium]
MLFVIFTHSLVSDWNHGNAHFLRGIATELVERGEDVRIFEPRDGWSLRNLISDCGSDAVAGFERAYPRIRSTFYDLESLDLAAALDGADAVIVHEWNEHQLVSRIGEYRARHGSFSLFFHDTHHRSVTDPASMAGYDLSHYDGVLAYGNVIRDIYRERRWARRAWTWHEAADTRVFYPRIAAEKEGDLVWIGNWGDEERSHELREFLIRPVRELGLTARVYGVRYPRHALHELADAGIEYAGWLPNYRVPEVFARYRVTVHVPRRPYARALPDIPTIRPFEAMACGIPMISAPWQDSEELFRPSRDFLFASSGNEMIAHLRNVLTDPPLRQGLIDSGLETINARHTCSHRVSQLLGILAGVGGMAAAEGAH